jgi:RHS repeat-associated protein
MSDGAWTFAYDLAGNETAMTANDGGSAAIHVDRGYDASGRLTSLTDSVGAAGTTLHSYTYGYDANGYSSSVSADGTTTNYTYDGLGQTLTATTGANTTSYTYDTNQNRSSLNVTGVGATAYSYDAANVRLTSQTGPDGKVTNYGYDTNGDITTETYDPTGANQVTGYVYGPAGGLTEVDQPDGSKVQFTYDADGQRLTKTVTSAGPNPTTTTIKDVYASGRVAYQTDGSGTVLARFAYDMQGAPVSVQVGADPATAPRYYYVYNGHGDVVALVDALGVTVATYTYDAFGVPTSVAEGFPNGWTNPYRYDGRGGQMRYDAETGLYIVGMGARAYDPTLGRYLSPSASLSYVYADNNPLGAGGSGQGVASGAPATPATPAAGDPMYLYSICPSGCGGGEPSITLGGVKFMLSDVASFTSKGSVRLTFVKLYGMVYSGQSGTNWLRSETDFLSYLTHWHRITRSPYWNGVDAEGLMWDMFMAVYHKQHTLGDSPKKSIHFWIQFISNPGPVFFWLAHNDSISLASFSSYGRYLFHLENRHERNFINAADWALFVSGVVEVGMYWAEPLLSILPIPMNVTRYVLDVFLDVCGPQGVCVGLWAGRFYPKDYPAPWWWKWTPVGWLMTKVGCIHPLFRWVSCEAW